MYPLLFAGWARSRQGARATKSCMKWTFFRHSPRLPEERVPEDRVIDGIDLSEFLMGVSEESGRNGLVVYMGNDVFGVKWRDWKIHLKEQSGWNGVLREYTMPRVYNLINDPFERGQRSVPEYLGTKDWSGSVGGARGLAEKESPHPDRRLGPLRATEVTMAPFLAKGATLRSAVQSQTPTRSGSSCAGASSAPPGTRRSSGVAHCPSRGTSNCQ